jgi:hypothetical protein
MLLFVSKNKIIQKIIKTGTIHTSLLKKVKKLISSGDTDILNCIIEHDIENIPLDMIVNDLSLDLYNTLRQNKHDKLNIVFSFILREIYENKVNLNIFSSAFEKFNIINEFKSWFANLQIFNIEHDLSCRCLDFIKIFYKWYNIQDLIGIFSEGIDLVDDNLSKILGESPNKDKSVTKNNELTFAKIMEVILIIDEYSKNQTELENIEEKIKIELQKQENENANIKQQLDIEVDKYMNIQDQLKSFSLVGYSTREDIYNLQIAAQESILNIQFMQKELSRFQYTHLIGKIPFVYIVYQIFFDTDQHFSDYIKQMALYSMVSANEEKEIVNFNITSAHKDFIKENHFEIRLFKGITKIEFLEIFKKAIRFFNKDVDLTIVKEVLEFLYIKMPELLIFLYKYSLKLIDRLLERKYGYYETKGYNLRYWTRYIPPKDVGPVIKRYLEVIDYTQPNSIGISYDLFLEKHLILPVLFHEFLHYTGILNEAEVFIRESAYFNSLLNNTEYADVFNPVFSLIRKSILLEKTLVEKLQISKKLFDSRLHGSYGLNLLLHIYVVYVEEKDLEDKKDEIARILDNFFVTELITKESLSKAEDLLFNFEPLVTLFNLENINEKKIAEINEFIEGLYGKQLTREEAKIKSYEDIIGENNNISRMNDALLWNPDKTYPYLDDNSDTKKELEELLIKKHTQKNTIDIDDLKRIINEIKLS